VIVRKARQAARLIAVAAVSVLLIGIPAEAANGPSPRVAFIRAHALWVLDLGSHVKHAVLAHAGVGPVRWSGDGRLVSSGGRIAGGPALPTSELVWAPQGEVAAGVTGKNGVFVWTPRGTRQLEPDRWGATTVAWSDNGRLAIGRTIYGPPHNQELWVWDGGPARPTLLFKTGTAEPYPATWQGKKVVWWNWPNSGSIAADGVALYVDREKVGTTLMYRDFIADCGTHLAYAAGGDRYATRGKRIVVDGRDVSQDPSRSWVSPACSRNGSLLVAAAGRNWEETRFGREHRSIWELRPMRTRLTRSPAGWTDESPQVLQDGSILFVRTKQTVRRFDNGKWYVNEHAELERLSAGVAKPVADLGFTAGISTPLGFSNYYGHYFWPSIIAVAP
jgi:hypothetical protein